MATILQVLSRLGPLEWYAVRPADLLSDEPSFEKVPTVTFRFVGGNDAVIARLREVLGQIDKDKNWRLVGEGEKNATLAPVAACIDDNTVSFEAIENLNRNSPELTRQITKEFLLVVDRLDEVIK